MTTEEKKDLRPYYSEFQGYLSQAPAVKNIANDYLYTPSEWEQINVTIDLLNKKTGKDFNRFKIVPEGGRDCVPLSLFRTRLGALISHIHGEYFLDEPAPFSGMPNTVITHNLNQQQSQQQSITLTLFEIRDKIDQKLANVTNEKEKSFLQKLKEQLPHVLTVMQLIQLILNLIHQTGVDVDTVRTLLA